jgi:hypothetical protein
VVVPPLPFWPVRYPIVLPNSTTPALWLSVTVSLKHSLTFLLISAACTAVGIRWGDFGLVAIVFYYASLSFALLAAAYAGAGPKLLLKQASGRRSVFSWVLFAPYLMLNAATFWAFRRLSAEPSSGQVSHNLFFGRRMTDREAEAMPCVHILDLAGEFSEVATFRSRSGYRSMPLLDAGAPSLDQLRDAAAWLASAVESGPVYVHCALGHGRSGCVVIAYLLASGQVKLVDDGLQKLRSVRPGAKPNAAQQRRLAEFHAGLFQRLSTEHEA